MFYTEQEGSKIAIVPLNIGEEAGPSVHMVEEISRDKSLEEEDCKAIEPDNKDEEGAPSGR